MCNNWDFSPKVSLWFLYQNFIHGSCLVAQATKCGDQVPTEVLQENFFSAATVAIRTTPIDGNIKHVALRPDRDSKG